MAQSDGPSIQKRARRAPQGPKSVLGEKWAQRAPPRGQMSVRVKEGRFSDGTFPIGKVTFLVFSRTRVKILKILKFFFDK